MHSPAVPQCAELIGQSQPPVVETEVLGYYRCAQISTNRACEPLGGISWWIAEMGEEREEGERRLKKGLCQLLLGPPTLSGIN